MITYEVKVTISPSVEGEWLNWMKEFHIPELLSTGLMKSFSILKPVSKEHIYLFHYLFESMKDYEAYTETYGKVLRSSHENAYQGMFEAKRQLLKWI